MDELQLELFIKALPNLTTLVLHSDHPLSHYNGQTISHISNFGRALQATACLCSLTLSNCAFDDDLVQQLILSLDENNVDGDVRNTLIHLDIVSLSIFLDLFLHKLIF